MMMFCSPRSFLPFLLTRTCCLLEDKDEQCLGAVTQCSGQGWSGTSGKVLCDSQCSCADPSLCNISPLRGRDLRAGQTVEGELPVCCLCLPFPAGCWAELGELSGRGDGHGWDCRLPGLSIWCFSRT